MSIFSCLLFSKKQNIPFKIFKAKGTFLLKNGREQSPQFSSLIFFEIENKNWIFSSRYGIGNFDEEKFEKTSLELFFKRKAQDVVFKKEIKELPQAQNEWEPFFNEESYEEVIETGENLMKFQNLRKWMMNFERAQLNNTLNESSVIKK